MKRLFTFAIIATMIASVSFANPAAKKSMASSNKIEKVVDVNAMQKKVNEAKAIEAVKAEKAQAPQTASSSVLRKAGNKAISGNQFGGKQFGKLSSAKSLQGCKFGPRRAETQEGNVTVTTDEHGIITDVTGVEAKFYTRSADGTAYYVSGQSMYFAAQSGTVKVIEDGDNVYIKDPITRYEAGSWVKGVKNGNTITIAVGQPLVYNSNYDATVSIQWGKITTEGNIEKDAAHGDAFTFTVDGNTWTLNGTQAYSSSATTDCYFFGAFWDDDNTSTGYGDAETVMTYDDGYVPPSTELVVLPEGATVEEWYFNGVKSSSSSTSNVKNKKVNVAFVGDDVYISGIFADASLAESWIKGTVSGTDISFENFQYLGKYSTYDIWAIGAVVEGESASMAAPAATYDAAAKVITFTTSLLANAAADRIYYLEWYDDVVLTAEEQEIVEPDITDLTSTVPYHNTFTTDDELEEAAIYDANEDGSTWAFVEDGDTPAARYRYSSANPGDDYLVFPGLPLEAGKSYRVSVMARAYSSYYTEKFEVVAGTEAKASKLNITVIPPTDVDVTDYTLYRNGDFTVSESGTYYFAIHNISDADAFYFYVSDFEVVVNDDNSPKPVDDLQITANPNGELKATVEFTVPSKTLGDETITSDLNVTVKRGGEVIMTGSKAPATKVELEDNVPAIGTYKYEVIVDYDGHISDAAALSAYIGEDVPEAPENVFIADHTSSIDVTWDAVTTGENGGIILPENMKYNVYPVVMEEFFGMLFPVVDEDNPYATGVTATEAKNIEYNTVEGEMQYSYVAVRAENPAGEGGDTMGYMVTGTPYELPVRVAVENNVLSTWLGITYNEGNLNGNASYDNEGGFSIENDAPGWVALETGKIALKGAINPVVDFDLSTASAGVSFELVAISPNGSEVLASLTPGAEPAHQSISLLNYKDADWVRVAFKAIFTEQAEASVELANIKIFNKLDRNLKAAGISAPAKVDAGENVLVNVSVINEGKENVAENAYTVELYCNEELVDTFEGTAIESGKRVDYEFEVPTNATSAELLTFKAVVVYEADEDQSDNTSKEVTTRVAMNKFPTPTELAATVEDNTVVLNWTAPDLNGGGAEEITDDFEDADAFAAEYGNWTFVDVDGSEVGGIQNIDIPGISVGATKGSFWIWDQAQVGNDTFAAHSGTKYLFALFRYDDGTTDDWAISPELTGDAQTISFYAKSYSASYPEKIAVYTSTGSLDPADFTLVEGSEVAVVPADWTLYQVSLPAGAKHFAIRSYATGSFMLMVDDVTYTVPGSTEGLELTGYNVYRDSEKIAETNDATYTDANVKAGETYVYAVSAVYNRGESAASNAVEVKVENDAVNSISAGKLGINAANKNIVISNAQGLELTVSAANGAVVFSGKGSVKTTVNVAPGVYVVKAGKTVKKVIVK